MNSTSSIALSGMQAAQQQLQAAAHNVANVATPGFRRQEVQQRAQPQGGVTTELQRAQAEGAALEADVVAQLQAKNAYLANLSVFKTADRMAGALLDRTA
ncbi:MAG: flagellar basal body protein [Rhodoferax sp.]|jgi:flagellar hook protein FlgE|nr:flagellar basal body rod protein [Rhodoferax sp.]